MSLTGLRTALSQEPTFANVLRQASVPAAQRSAETVIGAAEGLRAPLVAQISDGLAAADAASGRADGHAPVVLAVTATDREAEDLEAVLGSYLPEEAVTRFPAWETLPHERLSPRSDTVGQRLAVLRRLAEAGDDARVVIAPIRSVLQPIAASLETMRPVRLGVGEERDFEQTVQALSDAAYSRVDLVTRRGEFAVRGGILDVFSPVEDHPVRIEFFGDEVEQMRWFAVADQRTFTPQHGRDPQELIAPPCREILITPAVMSRAAKLKDSLPGAESMLERIAGGIYVEGMESLAPLLVDAMTTLVASLPAGSLAVLCEPERIRTRAADLVATNQEFLLAAWEQASDGQAAPIDLQETGLAAGSFMDVAEARAQALEAGIGWWAITSLGVDEAIEDDADTLTIAVRAPLTFAGDVQALLDVVAQHVREQWQVVAVTEGPGPLKRLAELFREADLPAAIHEDLTEPPAPGVIALTTAAHGTGFVLEEAKIAFLTEADVLGRASPYTTRDMRKLPAKRRRNAVDPLALKAGDYVVHEQHGIGRFVELIQRPIAGAMVKPGQPKPMKEYLVLEYAAAKRGAPKDRLFVPTDQLDQVTNYVGGDAPTLSKMGGSDWAKTKSRARRAVKEIAADLIRLYSARMASRGHAFAPDTPWQRELEDAFPYIETPDQLTTINEVKADMEKETPMDRLISGDVGYGKTEVAVRAAFKAVQDGKQVAILVPTTLLAQQHTETFTERFSGFPVGVATLSRFQTPKESQAVEAGIADGSVDVVIGTHRLLSQAVKFKDLGLVIIDEEQRFGVEHKEKLKTLRTNVDVLAMSATPIPRTLEMSLTGIRETSTLATPPEERHPVLTFVGPSTDQQVAAAIRRELMREGQVFFVHNRVSSIDRTAADLQRLVPEARIAVAHGQMSEARLEQIIVDFWEKRFDVLVCTTIVETGLDISNANTLIVDRADHYGLSQLHQLRGRVGRGRERAYAYFLYPPEKPLGEVALERLKAVAAHNELGAGMQLAMKDLEIRGAGNLLGGEQSGHIAGVGFDLYLRLVGEAVADFRGEKEEAAPAEMKIELPVDAHLPHDYVPGERLRLEAYRNLAAAATDEAVDEVAAELADRYGELPEPARNLLAIARLRIRARAAGLSEIMTMGSKIRFHPVDLPDSRRMRLERMYPGALVKPVPGTEIRQILVPKPKTAPVGGKDLVDGQILAWVREFIDAILA
ncbi:transcription-repair coupling factor [Rothia kristinae]|uniref:transcription-repair coupling factor n=3 Tax=Rothia kristinae TaxID=37923 RepID=UPI0021A8D553|nr:transcription-repair coupling factor [Rothia kristinae]MCT1356694.1 transcription-repair coupling factor [Rothia kristinae]MCT1392834.1 transcription-repair coupling factor [Rothia kristinae]MCT2243535.1 transcription-repair coupling factor [Rothia kristinae]MCT2245487.1 transcription-repair coupling factor [Rothia kristinae]MCT2322878.1 transcription-repair coupling factor [Rothia kristinae]